LDDHDQTESVITIDRNSHELQARLSALLPYRVAADLLQLLPPIDAGKSPERLRGHTLQVGKRLSDAVAEKPPIAATAITNSLD
jgi:hypothetical protein